MEREIKAMKDEFMNEEDIERRRVLAKKTLEKHEAKQAELDSVIKAFFKREALSSKDIQWP